MRKIVANRQQCNQLVHKKHPITLGPAIESTSVYTVHEGMTLWIQLTYESLILISFRPTCQSGSFVSPMVEFMSDLIPKESHEAKFQMILPKKWLNPKLKPVVIHLAGTGDHVCTQFNLFLCIMCVFLISFQYFTRRKMLMARPLVKESAVASILLENPFCKLNSCSYKFID